MLKSVYAKSNPKVFITSWKYQTSPADTLQKTLHFFCTNVMKQGCHSIQKASFWTPSIFFSIKSFNKEICNFLFKKRNKL